MEPDLPSDSDASDGDYRPSGEESDAASEEESEPDDENDDVEHENSSSKKKKLNKSVKRKNLKRKLSDIDEPEEAEDNADDKKTLSLEEEKKKADSIWADFLKDCDEPLKKKTSVNISDINNRNSVSEATLDRPKSTVEEKENKQTVTQVFEFAGETVRVERQMPISSVASESKSTNGTTREASASRGSARGFTRGRGGSSLTSFLGQIGKKGKLSVLEKSKLDWVQFKRSEGIEEDISQHNKGKDGYLDRQEFLQRTDLRRFEIEKSMRQKRSGR